MNSDEPVFWQPVTVDTKGEAYRRIWEPAAAGIELDRASQQADSSFEIRYFNDIHGSLFPEDPSRPSLIESLRQQANAATRPCLLLGGGDDHGGGSAWDLGMAQAPPLSFAYRLMSAAGVDAITLGNHDLDWGATALISALNDSQLRPVVSNIKPQTPLADWVAPARVFEMPNGRVGVLGLANCSQVIDANQHFLDPLLVIEKWIQRLVHWVDCIVVLSHLGNDQDPTSDDRALLPLLPKNALLCGAHSHQIIPSTGDSWSSTPYLQSGLAATTFGEAVWERENGWRTRNLSSQSLSSSSCQPTLRRSFETELEACIKKTGTIKIASNSHWNGSSTEKEFPILNWAADSLEKWTRHTADEKNLPILACVCSCFKSRSSIDLEANIDDWYRLFPYADRIVRFALPWSELPQWIARTGRYGFGSGEPGFLHADKKWRFTFANYSSTKTPPAITYQDIPYEADTHYRVQIVTHDFVAIRAIANAKDRPALLASLEVENTSLRELLWEKARKNSIALPPRGRIEIVN